MINSIRSNFVQQKAKYGQMVIACDNGSWRRDVFPQYKHSRREAKKLDDSGINWVFVNETVDELIIDLQTYFPFPTIRCPKTEGDDIIGTLAKYITNNPTSVEDNIFGEPDIEKILIISSDLDNAQLHMLGKHVKQWSPRDKKLIVLKDKPYNLLMEKIVKGDTGDGVPNMKMGDNTFVDKIRQKPISQKLLDQFYEAKDPMSLCVGEEQAQFIRNRLLVSYDYIPDHIQSDIISCYNNQLEQKHSKRGLMEYFVSNKMSNLLGQIHDFYL
jgi:hypothetical protein